MMDRTFSTMENKNSSSVDTKYSIIGEKNKEEFEMGCKDNLVNAKKDYKNKIFIQKWNKFTSKIKRVNIQADQQNEDEEINNANQLYASERNKKMNAAYNHKQYHPWFQTLCMLYGILILIASIVLIQGTWYYRNSGLDEKYLDSNNKMISLMEKISEGIKSLSLIEKISDNIESLNSQNFGRDEKYYNDSDRLMIFIERIATDLESLNRKYRPGYF